MPFLLPFKYRWPVPTRPTGGRDLTLFLEAHFVPTDALLKISSTGEKIDRAVVSAARLNLYSPEGDLAFSTTAVEATDKLGFRLAGVLPGVYTAEVHVGEDRAVVEVLMVSLSDAEAKLDQFRRAVERSAKADELVGAAKLEVLRNVRDEYKTLGLSDLAEDIEKEIRDIQVLSEAALGQLPVFTPLATTGLGAVRSARTVTQYQGTGRRKRAVVRVFLRSGKGEIRVNGRSFENYFPSQACRALVNQPLLATEMADKFDILINATGGGPSGQAGAAKLGIARALLEFNSELRATLKALGMLTRDAREHERKKYGQKGARKRFQFSKR